MKDEIFDAIVIGGGQAGLGIGYFLKNKCFNYLILEKGKIGDTWRNQRWDSFKLNSPNKYNYLPGFKSFFPDDDKFCSAPDFVQYLEKYSEYFHLPVKEGCEVISVEKENGNHIFDLTFKEKGKTTRLKSKHIVVASGIQNEKFIPHFAKNISPEIFQIHCCEYTNSSALPEGNVLVVGSAQSGTQIAEDLLTKNCDVFLSTSQVPRVPRRYRDKDIFEWFILLNIMDLEKDKVTDPQILKMRIPQVSGVGEYGHTTSIQSLAKKGVVILGKTKDADKYSFKLTPNAETNIKFSDSFSKNIKIMIDEYIEKNNLNLPLPVHDYNDEPDENAVCASNITNLNLIENNIKSIIWTTGFSGNFQYLKFPIFGDDGQIMHSNGISNIENLYYLGFPWLSKRKSGIILGIEEDAQFIADIILSKIN